MKKPEELYAEMRDAPQDPLELQRLRDKVQNAQAPIQREPQIKSPGMEYNPEQYLPENTNYLSSKEQVSQAPANLTEAERPAIGDEPLLDIFNRPTAPEYDEKRQKTRKAQAKFNVLGNALTALGDNISFSRGARMIPRDYSGHKPYIEDYMKYRDEHADKLQAFDEADYTRRLREAIDTRNHNYQKERDQVGDGRFDRQLESQEQRHLDGIGDRKEARKHQSGENKLTRQHQQDMQDARDKAREKELQQRIKAANPNASQEQIESFTKRYSDALSDRGFLDEFSHILEPEYEEVLNPSKGIYERELVRYGIPKHINPETLVEMHDSFNERMKQMHQGEAQNQAWARGSQQPPQSQQPQNTQRLNDLHSKYKNASNQWSRARAWNNIRKEFDNTNDAKIFAETGKTPEPSQQQDYESQWQDALQHHSSGDFETFAKARQQMINKMVQDGYNQTAIRNFLKNNTPDISETEASPEIREQRMQSLDF